MNGTKPPTRLVDFLTQHCPHDTLDFESGREGRECACGFQFTEPEDWAHHVATMI